MEYILSIFLGIGLAAAAGFRVFIPLLGLSIASHFGLPVGESFEWVGSFPAMISFGLAALLEVGAYYIPWVDNLLDSMAVPLATVAGTGVVAATLTDFSPLMTWGLAIIAGGGTASAISTATAGTRAVSSASTAGIGNPVVSSIETGTSIFLVIIAVVAPILAIIAVAAIFYLIYKMYRKLKGNKKLENTDESMPELE